MDESNRAGFKPIDIYRADADTHVFVVESGAVGMEHHGRMAIKQVAEWIALAWGDLRKKEREL